MTSSQVPAEDRRERGRIGLSERDVDGTFIVAKNKKGGAAVGPTKRGKGTKLMALADAAGLPLAVHATSASPAKSQPLSKQRWKKVS